MYICFVTSDVPSGNVIGHDTGQALALPVESSDPTLSPECEAGIHEWLVDAVDCPVVHLYMLYPRHLHAIYIILTQSIREGERRRETSIVEL